MTIAIAPLQKAFRSMLIAATPVTDIVKARIRPDTLEQNDPLPAIVIEASDDNPPAFLTGGDQATGTATVQVVCCAYDRPASLLLASAVRNALKEKDETTFDDVFLDEVTYEGVNIEYEPPEDWGKEKDWYFAPLRFFVIYRVL